MKKLNVLLPLAVLMLVSCGGTTSTTSIVRYPGTYRYEFEESDIKNEGGKIDLVKSDRASGTNCIGAFSSDTVLSFKLDSIYDETGVSLIICAASTDKIVENGVAVGTRTISGSSLVDMCYINGEAINTWNGSFYGTGAGDDIGSAPSYSLESFSVVSTAINLKAGENIIEFKNAPLSLRWDYIQFTTTMSKLKKRNDGITQIEFDSNGPGIKYDALYVNKGQLITEPTAPTYSYVSPDNVEYNFVFTGWYNGDIKWDFTKNAVSKHMLLKAKWRLEDSFYADKENPSLRAEGTTARIMAFNVLSEWYNKGAATSTVRTNYGFNTVMKYAPDVVSFQEFDEKWYDKAKTNLTGYKVINDDNRLVGGQITLTTMAYNVNTVKLIEYEQVRLTPSDNINTGNVVTALFEFISGDNIGKRFIVASTHWYLEEPKRILQASDMARILKGWEEKYPGVPLMSNGDFNAKDSFQAIKTYISETGYFDTKNAKEKGLVCDTYHGWIGTNNTYSYGPQNIMTTESIDHIFASSNVESLYYDTVVDKDALCASDHCPIYCDLKF